MGRRQSADTFLSGAGTTEIIEGSVGERQGNMYSASVLSGSPADPKPWYQASMARELHSDVLKSVADSMMSISSRGLLGMRCGSCGVSSA